MVRTAVTCMMMVESLLVENFGGNILLCAGCFHCTEMPSCSHGYYRCGVSLKSQMSVARFPEELNAQLWRETSRHLASLKIRVVVLCPAMAPLG